MRASARNGAWSSTISTRTAIPRCSRGARAGHHRVNPAVRPRGRPLLPAAASPDSASRPSRPRGARHVVDRHVDPAAPPRRLLRPHLPAVVVVVAVLRSSTWRPPRSSPAARWSPRSSSSVVTDGRAGYRDLGARMIRWRVGWTWWLVAVGTPLAVLAVAAAANVAIWGAPAPVLATLAWSQLALVAAIRFVNPLDGPLGEEPGWRGYAVPQLQAQRSPLASGLVLARVRGAVAPAAGGDRPARAGRPADHVRDHPGLRVAVQPDRRQRADDDGVPHRAGHCQLRRRSASPGPTRRAWTGSSGRSGSSSPSAWSCSTGRRGGPPGGRGRRAAAGGRRHAMSTVPGHHGLPARRRAVYSRPAARAAAFGRRAPSRRAAGAMAGDAVARPLSRGSAELVDRFAAPGRRRGVLGRALGCGRRGGARVSSCPVVPGCRRARRGDPPARRRLVRRLRADRLAPPPGQPQRRC